MEKVDQGVESVELLEAEIETLMMRLEETDPDALLRLEKVFAKFRVRRSVEKHCH